MPTFRAQLRSSTVLSWTAVLGSLAGWLCALPLVGALGYEFSLVFALAVSIAASDVGAYVVASTRRATRGTPTSRARENAVLRLLARASSLALLLLALPLALISLNALRVPNCNFLSGLHMFALLPGASALLGATNGVLWGLALRRRSRASIGALLTIGASVAWGLYRFYATPPVSGYDPFVGYFAGPLYDELVTVRAPVYWARLYHFATAGAFVCLALTFFDPGKLALTPVWRGPERRAATFGLALFGLAALVMGAHRAELGFAVSGEHIASELGGRYFSRHFELIYPREWPAARVARHVEDHEFRYAQLRRRFGAAPARIRSFVFRDAQEKRRLIGTGGVLVAKPWRREVYLESSGFPMPALRHELAHVFAAAFGDPLFGLSLAWRAGPLGVPYPHISVGLIEGVAVAFDWPSYGELDGQQRAAALARTGLAPPLEALFGIGFLAHAGARSYAYAGAFCRFLLERHGPARLLALYRSAGDFERAYGQPLERLAAAWRDELARTHVPERLLQLTAESFRRPAIFRRVCPHELARLRAEVGALHESGDTARAARLMGRIVRHDPGDPEHLLALLELRAEGAGARSALALRAELLGHPALSPPLRRRALEQLGDLSWAAGDVLAAARDYEAAARLAADPSARRVLELKQLGLRQDRELRAIIMGYIVRVPGDRRPALYGLHLAHELSAMRPTWGLGPYLVAKQLEAHELCSEAVPQAREALRRGLPNDDFALEAQRTLATCAYETGDLSSARAALRALRSARSASRGLRGEAADWLERVEWRASTR